MVEKGIQLGRDNLISFLDFVAEKGLMKSQTAIAYKKASNVILGILDKTEAADLSKINLEEVILRHRNLASNRIKPTTLKAYEARTRAAIGGFIEYTKDPSSWKPTVQQRPSRTVKAAPSGTKLKTDKSEKIAEPEGTLGQPSVHIDLQIHISPEATPEQIDQIFASMRRHLYGNTMGK